MVFHITRRRSLRKRVHRVNFLLLGLFSDSKVVMAVAESCSSSGRSTSFNCYKVASMTETILNAKQTSNLKDRYVLGEQLGWGQFGVIRTCSDRTTGEVLACKSIAKDRLVTSDDMQSVKLEIQGNTTQHNLFFLKTNQFIHYLPTQHKHRTKHHQTLPLMENCLTIKPHIGFFTRPISFSSSLSFRSRVPLI